MSHDLAFRDGRNSFAFTGDRSNIWHRLGQAIAPDQSIDEWAVAAGLDFEAVLLPAYAELNGRRINHGYLNVHNKTGHAFGHVSQVYKNVQPLETLQWFEQYISHDPRFKLSAAGALRNGERIWATAEFEGGFKSGGEAHKAYLLMTTTFDGSGATVNQASFTRAVCQNTILAAMSDSRAVIRTRHSTKFDAGKVARELEAVVKSVDSYKAMGDAMAETTMRRETVAKYFKRLLEIPFDAKSEDVSARKLNQFSAMGDAYRTTVQEGAPAETVWAALNAVTRYVDHDRSTRGGDESQEAARFLSANFGSGAALKSEAIRLLTADEDMRELIRVR